MKGALLNMVDQRHGYKLVGRVVTRTDLTSGGIYTAVGLRIKPKKLTTDGRAARFTAPAGLTGLWQVTRRRRGDFFTRERIEPDNLYATRHSFWFDLKLMLKMLPAFLQSKTM